MSLFRDETTELLNEILDLDWERVGHQTDVWKTSSRGRAVMTISSIRGGRFRAYFNTPHNNFAADGSTPYEALKSLKASVAFQIGWLTSKMPSDANRAARARAAIGDVGVMLAEDGEDAFAELVLSSLKGEGFELSWDSGCTACDGQGLVHFDESDGQRMKHTAPCSVCGGGEWSHAPAPARRPQGDESESDWRRELADHWANQIASEIDLDIIQGVLAANAARRRERRQITVPDSGPIAYHRGVTCPECYGRRSHCQRCNSSGSVAERVTLDESRSNVLRHIMLNDVLDLSAATNIESQLHESCINWHLTQDLHSFAAVPGLLDERPDSFIQPFSYPWYIVANYHSGGPGPAWDVQTNLHPQMTAEGPTLQQALIHLVNDIAARPDAYDAFGRLRLVGLTDELDLTSTERILA